MPTDEKKNCFNEKILPYFHSVGLISVPIGRFPGGAQSPLQSTILLEYVLTNIIHICW